MPRFILLDNSLRGIGGHHYQYARDVLSAASGKGYETALVSHQEFAGSEELPVDHPVLALFRHNGYSDHALCFGGGADGALGVDGRALPADPAEIAAKGPRIWQWSWPKGLRGMWARWRRRQSRRRYLEDYVLALRTTFDALGVFPGDEIFFATSSDFDVLGLVRYLLSDPRSVAANWRVQFHFNLLEGRDHEYDGQERVVRLAQRQLAIALAQVPHHRLAFYATTDELCAQYNRLNLVRFQCLSYPSGPGFFPRDKNDDLASRAGVASSSESDSCQARWQIALAGHLRREKGKGKLRNLVERLDARPDARQLRIRIQHDRPPRWIRRRRHVGVQVERMPHPLASETYAALVRNSDVGMFLYDSRRYVARCSGILVEMLSSGVPVIVPAGCWLSAQINAPNQAWLAQVAGRHAEAETVYVPRPRDAIEIDLPLGVGQVLVELDLATDDPLAKSPSASLEVRVVQSGSRMTASNTFVVDDGGSPASERLVRVMVDRAAGADRIRWSFASPFGGSVPQLASVSLRLISERTGDEPHGALGVTVASIDEAPAALDQILRHHDHYRRQAAAFSELWRREHSPETVVERLTAHVPDGQRSTRAA